MLSIADSEAGEWEKSATERATHRDDLSPDRRAERRHGRAGLVRREMSAGALQGRVALVTGAGRGIGRQLALGLAGQGVAVGLLARSERELDRLRSEIRDRGGQAAALPADVGDAEAIRAAVSRCRAELGEVEILVNNAAVVWPLGPTPGLDSSAVNAALSINVVGAIALCSVVLPAMLSVGWGRIVNVSSGIVTHPGTMIGGGVYVASKAALEAFTANLAAELEGSGVSAHVYRPGAVDTPMQQWLRSQTAEEIGPILHERYTSMHAEGRLIPAQYSADQLLARLSDDDRALIWDVDAHRATR